MKKMLVMMLMLALCMLTAVPALAADAITPDYSWYSATATELEINSVAQLAALAKITQGNVKVDDTTTIAKDDFQGKTVKLTADLSFTADQYWYYNDNDKNKPIYNYQIEKFAGTFDGNNHKITGLKFHKKQNAQFNLGLFTSITADGSVKNLTLNNVEANIAQSWTKIGSIATELSGNAVNCHVDTVNYTVAGYLNYSGGMFGAFYNNAQVEKSTAKNISITITGNDNGQHVGGFVGHIGSAEITECSVENVSFDCSYKLKRFGGFVGYSSNTTLTDCTAANVKFDVDDYVYVTGGFVGMAAANSNFNNCDVHGVEMKLTRETTGPTRVGGFCGTVSNGSGTTSSFADCDVTGLDITMNAKVQSSIGGFLGYSDSAASINRCTVVGKIDATNTSDESAAVGGFIGSTTKATTIVDSSADVDVKATADAGGFAGDASNLTIESSQALGDVASDNGAAGGFAGSSSGNTSLKDCESSGSVSSTNGAAAGLIGLVEANADTVIIDASCQPTTGVTGAITDKVANTNGQHKEENEESNFNSSSVCYVTAGNCQIGYPSIQAAVDAGADNVTLLKNLTESFSLNRTFELNLSDFTLNGNITFPRGTFYVDQNHQKDGVIYGISISVNGDSEGSNIILTEPLLDHHAFEGWCSSLDNTPKYDGNRKDGWKATPGHTYHGHWAHSDYTELGEELHHSFVMEVGGSVPAARSITFEKKGDPDAIITDVYETGRYFTTVHQGLVVTVKPNASVVGLAPGAYQEMIHVRVSDESTHTITATLLVIDTQNYTITSGANQTVEPGKPATFISNADLGKFVRVEVDGKELERSNYLLTKGSTKVTLKAEFMATLTPGVHTLTIVSTDGSASTMFTVLGKAAAVPQTGDNSQPMLWLSLMAASGVVLLAMSRKRSKA